MHKILITGGAGFVGRHFVKRLLDQGHVVHCVDSLVPFTGGIDPAEGWPLFDPYDYANFFFYREDCRAFFNRAQDDDFDYCFHLAAIVGGRLMVENKPLAVADDLSIDAHYWQWAERSRPGKTISFSSSAAYPIIYQRREGYQLLREDMISFDEELGMPDMSYGWSKLTHEYLGRLAYQKHGVKSVCYRPFSGYGEDQDDTYPFPSICKRALKHQGEPVLYVWGTGDQMRDFIHIEDCVDGVLRTMDMIDYGDAINLATGHYTTFKQFAQMAANACGYEPEVKGLADKPSGVFARGGDTAKLKSLGFEHNVDFQQGIEQAIAYFAQTADLSRVE